VADLVQRARYDEAVGSSTDLELLGRESAQTPVPKGELVPGQRRADRLVVTHQPLVLAVEGDERELRSRRRLRLGAPRAVVAARKAGGRQEGEGAAVDSTAMKVLLTGASGFVGRALQDELGHAGGAYEVHPLGRADGDLADDGVAEAAIAEARPDVVVHAAARIGVVRCDEEPELALRSNVLATTLVAHAAALHDARLAYLSTSDVYGSAVEADEQTPPAPESLYALSKLWGEQAAALCAPEGLTILRLANPYGPGVDAGQAKGAVPTMLRQADAGETIPVFRGEARTFCWIGDVVRAIRLVLESGEEGLFNIGADGEAVALADVARLACELTGAPPELIEEVEPPPGRVMTRIATERVRALGWRPEVALDEGMRLLLDELRAAAPA
jgi:nucleoside-diphosphate-sugar epimerase